MAWETNACAMTFPFHLLFFYRPFLFTSTSRHVHIYLIYCIFHAAQVISLELCPCFRLRAKWREVAETEHHTVIRFLRKHSRNGNTTPEPKSWRCCWQLLSVSDPVRMFQGTLSLGIQFQYEQEAS